ncbi:MAG: hypothetical protein Q9211_004189 [Gyalolechia sp. 1 TL-2023]
MACNIQATKKEDEGDGDFSPRLHLQVPQPRDWQDQECNVGDDIWRRGEEKADMRRVDALAIGDRFIPEALDWATDEELADDERDEPCSADYTDGNAPHGELADDKDSTVEEEDGEFQGKAADCEGDSTSEETLSHNTLPNFTVWFTSTISMCLPVPFRNAKGASQRNGEVLREKARRTNVRKDRQDVFRGLSVSIFVMSPREGTRPQYECDEHDPVIVTIGRASDASSQKAQADGQGREDN